MNCESDILARSILSAIIKKIRKRVDKAINKLIKKIRKKFRKMFKGKKGKKGDAKKIKEDNKKGKPGKITDKDKRKHKQIVRKIKKKLKKPSKKGEKFETFHKRKQKEAKQLENKYQRQLKKGINLDIKFRPVKKDEKDGDVDMTIKIAPNDETDTLQIPVEGMPVEEAHKKASKEADPTGRYLMGRGEHYTRGRKGHRFDKDVRERVDALGYGKKWFNDPNDRSLPDGPGDHSNPSIKEPGYKTIRSYTKAGRKVKPDGKVGYPNWTPDHQPPDTLVRTGGAKLRIRFYAHSKASIRIQSGVVRKYKYLMQKYRNRKPKWAEGVKHQWFWEKK